MTGAEHTLDSEPRQFQARRVRRLPRRQLEDLSFDEFDTLVNKQSQVGDAIIILDRPPPPTGFVQNPLHFLHGHPQRSSAVTSLVLPFGAVVATAAAPRILARLHYPAT